MSEENFENEEKEVVEEIIEEKNEDKKNTEEIIEEDIVINQKKTYSKRNILIISTVLIFIIITIFSVIFAILNVNNTKIYSNVSINGIDVSNLTKQEAVNKITDIVNTKLNQNLTLKNDEYEVVISGEQLNINLDIDKSIQEAFDIGRTGNIIQNNYDILFSMINNTNIEIDIVLDTEIMEEQLKDISLKIPGAVQQSSYYIENDNLILVSGIVGYTVDIEALEHELVNNIQSLDTKNQIIELIFIEVEPDEINIENIRAEVYKEPQDAYVSSDPVQIHTHVNGVDLNMTNEEIQALLEVDKVEYEIPLKYSLPNKTISDLGEEAFPEVIASYSTKYDITNSSRSTNVELSANKINGTIILPGETFSFNQVVGQRTLAAGYKEAGSFLAGEVVESVGGGICQTSSTLYNAALLANLEITERYNHSLSVSYVPAGRDATVTWGGADFKFKNDRTYPIKIEASAKNGVMKVSFYGVPEEIEYEVVIQSKITSYISYTTTYQEDSTLEKGKEVVIQSGYNGHKCETYKILKSNGTIISQTLLSKDTYNAMQKIISIGTKE